MRNAKKRRPRSQRNSRDHYSHSPSPSRGVGSGRSTPADEEGSSLRSSPNKDSPSNTPDRRSLASVSTTSSMTPSNSVTDTQALSISAVPPLPMVVTVRKCWLQKRPPSDPVGGWGVVLRGTTSEFKQGIKVYTCHVDSVRQGSSAMVSSLPYKPTPLQAIVIHA